MIIVEKIRNMFIKSKNSRLFGRKSTIRLFLERVDEFINIVNQSIIKLYILPPTMLFSSFHRAAAVLS